MEHTEPSHLYPHCEWQPPEIWSRMPIQPAPSPCCSHPASAQQSHGRSCPKSAVFGVRCICPFHQQCRKSWNLCPGIACFRMRRHNHGYFRQEVLLRFGTSRSYSMSTGEKTSQQNLNLISRVFSRWPHLIPTTGSKEVIRAAFPPRVQRIVRIIRIQHYCWLPDRNR